MAGPLRILDEPEAARHMSSEARRIATERFDEQLVFQRVKAEYRRLLREKGLPFPVTCSTEATETHRLIRKQ
jgi:hypothetical protein